MGLVIVLGLGGDVFLGLNGTYLGEFDGFEVSRAFLEVMHFIHGTKEGNIYYNRLEDCS